jgi:hypothetical protein
MTTMRTRIPDPNAPLSQERYMKSPEYNQLRGVSAIAAAARAAIIVSAEKRKLIWFFQALSIADCGLRKVADELITRFADRISEDSVQIAIHGDHTRGCYGFRFGALSVEEFIIDLCINPLLSFQLPGDAGNESAERNLARSNYRGVSEREFKTAELQYFKDVVGALAQYKSGYERQAKEKFVHTTISRKVFETLDYALSTRSMVLLDGLEGRGKTEAVKAWCELHLGEARFVSLKGINNKTTAFREIAKALGIAYGYGYKSTDLQGRIEDVLQRSKLMLVLDEAHFIFNQRQRIYTRPELVDWIDTSIANRRLPIALVSTPQFMICMTRAASQVDWNYRQFRRRVRRYVKLPERNTPRDIEAVIRSVLPGAPNSAVTQVKSYVHLTKRDLSAVGDVVDEIKALQGRDVLEKVTYEQVTAVIDEHLVPSEKNFIEAITEAEKKVSPRGRKLARPAAPEIIMEGAEDLPSEPETERSPENDTGHSRIGNNRSAGAPRLEQNLITG